MWGYDDELPCLKLDLPSECGGDDYDDPWGDDDSWGSDEEEEEDSSDSGSIFSIKLTGSLNTSSIDQKISEKLRAQTSNCSPKMFGLQGS